MAKSPNPETAREEEFVMPAQTIWMIRLSLIYFLLSALIGGLLLIHKTMSLHPALWLLLPLHYEMAIWGWMVQFVMGTAYWMLPRFLKGKIRGPAKPAWWMFILFNAGLLLLLISFLAPGANALAPAGRFLMMTAILLFCYLMWNRIASFKHHGH